jgi:hypothetical protein
VCYGFIRISSAAWNKELHRHSQLTSPTEEWAFQKWLEGSWCHHVKAFRDRVQFSISDDKTSTDLWVSSDELISDTEFFAECFRCRFCREKSIGTVLKEESIAVLGTDNTTDAFSRFKECNIKWNIALRCFVLQAVARR